MRKILKAALVLITILTITYVAAVVHANANSNADSNDNGKSPIEYGISKGYYAEKLETEPHEWNTTEELGITFGKRIESAEVETYYILIVDPQKALPWMNGTAPMPCAIKHDDKFYQIGWLWIDLAEPIWLKQWQVPTGVILATGWFCIGIVLYKGRKKE